MSLKICILYTKILNFSLFNSVYDEINIHYNHLDKAKSKEETEHLLKLLHLEKVKHHYPFEISTGQKRRLSVATALSSKAKLFY